MQTIHRLVAVACLLTAACAGCSSWRVNSSKSRVSGRSAVKVQVTADGRVSLHGRTLTVPALARRLRREANGRTVVLAGGKGVSILQLSGIRDQLVRGGLPNVAIMTPPIATATTLEDDPPATPPARHGKPSAVAPQLRPARRR